MSDVDPQTETLLAMVAKNDKSAIGKLMNLHRSKLRRMVSVRMDRRLAARFDPSDVVQETLVTAIRQLPQYLAERPVSFYPWLRDIAMNRLIDLHRQHVLAHKRKVDREEPIYGQPLPDESKIELARRLVDPGSSPSRRMEKRETQQQVKVALERLSPNDREVLVLKYMEELSAPEIAAILNVTERTVWRRHARAVEQISRALAGEEE